MTYEKLKEVGTFLGERDWNNNGIYSGTYYYYLYNDIIYTRREPTNAFQYQGEPETFPVVGNVGEKLKKHGHEYWRMDVSLSEEVYEKLQEIYEKQEETQGVQIK